MSGTHRGVSWPKRFSRKVPWAEVSEIQQIDQEEGGVIFFVHRVGKKAAIARRKCGGKSASEEGRAERRDQKIREVLSLKGVQ